MRSWFLLALFIPVETAASGSLVVLGSTVELPAPAVAAPPVERCRERPRLLTPMLVGYARLQAADAHSTLWAMTTGAVESNPDHGCTLDRAFWAALSANEALLQRRESVAAVGRDAWSATGSRYTSPRLTWLATTP